MIRIVELNDTREQEYEEFVSCAPDALLYGSARYRRLLRTFLGAEDRYLLALEDGQIRGVLPAFLSSSARSERTVLNSLPFYGSHGSVIAHEASLPVRRALLASFWEMAAAHRCLTATLITSPFEPVPSFYADECEATFTDHRIGQVTRLPREAVRAEDALLEAMAQVRRTCVRKASRQGFEIRDDGSEEALAFLIETHQENMREMGGLAKPASFFELLPRLFTHGRHFRIYTAWHEGRPVAALLLFYYNRTVEYFTPVVKAEYRSQQPLALLVFEAMKRATADGCAWWNWGGTWPSQDGVYRFKNQWGAEDRPYHYYTRVLDDCVLGMTAEEMLREFPYFYVMPFSQCSTRGHQP